MEFSVGLTAVGRNGFNGCTALLDLGTDSYVTSRQFYSTPVLKLVDLRGCTSLEVIGSETFSTARNTCTFLLDGCTALKSIYSSAFAGHGAAVELGSPSHPARPFMEPAARASSYFDRAAALAKGGLES